MSTHKRSPKTKHGANTYIIAFYATFVLFVAALAYGARIFLQSRNLSTTITTLQNEKISLEKQINEATQGDIYKKYEAITPVVQSYSTINRADIIDKLVIFYDNLHSDADNAYLVIDTFAIDKGGELTIDGYTHPVGPSGSGLKPLYIDSNDSNKTGLLTTFARDYDGKLTNIRINSFTRIAQDDKAPSQPTNSRSTLAALQASKAQKQNANSQSKKKRAGGYEFNLTATFVLPDDITTNEQ